MRSLILLIISLIVASCSSLTIEDVPATLHTDMTAWALESTLIAQSIRDDMTPFMATVESQATQISQVDTINQILVATVRANAEPTRGVRLALAEEMQGGIMGLDLLNTSDGVMRFFQIGTAAYVRPQDGCMESHQNFFQPSANQIYLTTLGVNLAAGTILDVNWSFQGQSVYRESRSITADQEAQCIWFLLTPSNASFTPGNWTVTFMVNGRSINNYSFSIVG
ncbi:hypothetical protein MASR2M15_06650 [Anaerolineales bacterium]